MPKDAFFSGYNKIIRNFLWNNKPSQIRYDKLIQHHDNGGLKFNIGVYIFINFTTIRR